MTRLKYCFLLASAAALCTSCAGPPAQPAAKKIPEESGAFRIYVTNEVSGDLTVIDSATYNVIATVPLGKRPRGIHASPDRKTLHVALSGSPIAGPDVDESTLPPPDKSADGIGVFDVAQNKLVRTITGGSDPESFDLSKDGTQLYISNEGQRPWGIALSPDGKILYSANGPSNDISVVDIAANIVIRKIRVDASPLGRSYAGTLNRGSGLLR